MVTADRVNVYWNDDDDTYFVAVTTNEHTVLNKVTRDQAVQVADMLYLLTKERP